LSGHLHFAEKDSAVDTFDKHNVRSVDDTETNFFVLLNSLHTECDASLSELPGINVDAGLCYTGGDAAFYLEILRRFRDTYAQSAAEIQRLWDTQSLKDAHRLAHNVRGVADTIGAKELQQAAKRVGDGFRTGELDPMPSHLATFETCLRIVTDGLDILGSPELAGDDNPGQKQ
jgi:HPt (histidine-containing phosphotransfer) domain-containing protein